MESDGGLVSIVSSPHAGRLEGVTDRPEFEPISPKTAPVATHCESATCRSVTWKNLPYTCPKLDAQVNALVQIVAGQQLMPVEPPADALPLEPVMQQTGKRLALVHSCK